MAADDGRGSQRGERQSAGSARGNSNTNNSARGDARESRSQESSRSGSGSGVGTNAPSRGTGGNTGPSRSSGASDRNNGQSGARESRGVTAGSVGAVGRENDRSIGRGLAGAAGLAGPSLGGNVTSTYQGRPSSVASAALSRQSLAPDRAMPTGPVRSSLSATGFGPIGDMAANAYGAVKSAIAPTFRSAMSQNDMIDRSVNTMIGVESANNPKAKNPLSSATGLGQFINSTWMSTVEKYRPDLVANLPRSDVLAMRNDPVLSRQMTKAHAIDNAQKLAAAKVAVTPGSLYAAHFLGVDTAVKAYRADPNTPAVNVTGALAASKNGNIISGKTVGQLLGWADRKMASAAAPAPSQRFAQTYLGKIAEIHDFKENQQMIASGTADNMSAIDYFSKVKTDDPYRDIPATDTLGMDQIAKFRSWNSDPLANNRTTLDSVDPTMRAVVERAQQISKVGFVIGSGLRSKEDQQKAKKFGWSGTLDSDHLDGTAVDAWGFNKSTGAITFDRKTQAEIARSMKQAARELGVNLDVGANWGKPDAPHFALRDGPTTKIAQRAPASSTISPSQDIATATPVTGAPRATPVNDAIPTRPVKSTAVSPVEDSTIKQPLSTSQKIAAGAVDVGVGMIPGVGLAATVYNGLASITGQPTIGGMAVDLLGGGSNLGTGGTRRNEESGRRSNYEPPEPKEPETTIKKPPEIERFRERYLIPVVNRPTPSQKWGRRAARDRPPA